MITFGGQGGGDFGGGVIGGGAFYAPSFPLAVDPGTYDAPHAPSSPIPTPPDAKSGWGDFFRFAGTAAVTAAFTKYLTRDDGKTQLPRGSVSPIVTGSRTEPIVPGGIFGFPIGGGAVAGDGGPNPLLFVFVGTAIVVLLLFLRKGR